MRTHVAALLLTMAVVACDGEATSSDDGNESVGSGGAGTNVGAGGSGAAGGSESVAPPTLPTATGTCPTFENGDVTFSPAGITPRPVRLTYNETTAAAQDGPLVFYWHGTGSSPVSEPPYGLGDTLSWVVEAGGIVAAPHSDATSGTWPWFLTAGGDDETDLVLADEIVACAAESLGIDTTRIHSIGMSAGGLNTTQMSYRRSNYLASVVTYSGGILGPAPSPVGDHPFAAMIFHGGPEDIVVVNFEDLSLAYLADLHARGHFAFACNHGGGHIIPTGQNEQSSVRAFFEAHPWGTPSPYGAGLPEGFPTYCTL